MMKLIVALHNFVIVPKHKNNIISQCDSLLSEDIKITTNKSSAMAHLAEKMFFLWMD